MNLLWEPTTFIFRGYDSYSEGLKSLFFMVSRSMVGDIFNMFSTLVELPTSFRKKLPVVFFSRIQTGGR